MYEKDDELWAAYKSLQTKKRTSSMQYLHLPKPCILRVSNITIERVVSIQIKNVL